MSQVLPWAMKYSKHQPWNCSTCLTWQNYTLVLIQNNGKDSLLFFFSLFFYWIEFVYNIESFFCWKTSSIQFALLPTLNDSSKNMNIKCSLPVLLECYKVSPIFLLRRIPAPFLVGLYLRQGTTRYPIHFIGHQKLTFWPSPYLSVVFLGNFTLYRYRYMGFSTLFTIILHLLPA